MRTNNMIKGDTWMSSLSRAIIVVAITVFFFLAACAGGEAKAADPNPPDLLSFDLDPREVDTGQSDQQITITAHIIARNGFNFAQAQFYHPFSKNEPPVILKRARGNETDGVYKGTATLKKDSYPGTWRIEYIKMDDKPGNITRLSGEDLAKSKFPAEFQVKMGIFWAWIWVLMAQSSK
jgi:hypothetical protein